MAYEVNFDGLVGPTHNFSGLSFGNIASFNSQSMVSHPRAAALQGLDKMKFLMDLGIPQGILPPHERPHLMTLRQLGFFGSDADILQKVLKENPELLLACSSAASMWAANTATISPSADTADTRVHLTPANLSSKFHRSIEPSFTSVLFKQIFANERYFALHPPLPAGSLFADEGAANHNRFCQSYSDPGVELFVYGRHGFKEKSIQPKTYPARQTYEACQALSRTHLLNPDNTLFVQQNPEAIDAGVFHNDVISVANENLFFFHERAFVDPENLFIQLRKKIPNLIEICVKESEISLSEAVSSYLFNSQLVTLNTGKMALIAPTECLEIQSVKRFLDQLIQKNRSPISTVYFQNLRESMANGGGPACLRLRTVLTDEELNAIHPSVLLTDLLYTQLKEWVQKHYRETLTLKELGDPHLLRESQTALDALTHLLHLAPLYSFQIGNE